MHSGFFKLLIDPEYRDRLFIDIEYWLILFGLSYFILLVLQRDLFVKDKSVKILLSIAIGLAIIANLLYFFTLNSPSVIMILNAPLICVVVYRLSYEAYLKVYNKPPLSPFEMTYNFQEGLTKERIFNFVVMLTIGLISGFLVNIK